MSEDLAARIRDRLDLNGHEDWCPAVAHKCCGGQCECATGALLAALREVLRTCDRIEVDLWGKTYWPGKFIADEFRRVIAEALGVSPPDSPAGNAGVLPVGDTTSDGDAA